MIEPLRFSVTVPLSPAEAFLLFTEQMSSWWPLPTHSVGQHRAERVEFEPWAGGRIVEHTRDGEEHVWGEVLVAQPPHRIVFTWHPGLDADTEVEVTFRSIGDETEVTLEHRRWETLGDAAEATRTGYANGWPFVFVQRYPAAAKGELS